MTQRRFKRVAQYGLELLIVFVGVWLGLLAENYREKRHEIADEQVSLERIARDLEFDQRDMTGSLRRAQSGLASAQWLLDHSDTAEAMQDSLRVHLEQLQFISVFVANTSEYTSLRSAGRLNIIRDRALGSG